MSPADSDNEWAHLIYSTFQASELVEQITWEIDDNFNIDKLANLQSGLTPATIKAIHTASGVTVAENSFEIDYINACQSTELSMENAPVLTRL